MSIGQIISRQNVEQAVLTTLHAWLENTYLPAVEAQNSLDPPLPRPPSPDSYYGGVDTTSWREQDLPAIIVTAEPADDAVRYATTIVQWFEVSITTIVVRQNEDDARALADWYGAAIMALIAQHEDLGGIASSTLILEAPRADYVDPEQREFAQSTFTFRSLIQDMVDDNVTPAAPGFPQPDVPTVETTNLTFQAVPDDQQP